jgi:hypothetical protein
MDHINLWRKLKDVTRRDLWRSIHDVLKFRHRCRFMTKFWWSVTKIDRHGPQDFLYCTRRERSVLVLRRKKIGLVTSITKTMNWLLNLSHLATCKLASSFKIGTNPTKMDHDTQHTKLPEQRSTLPHMWHLPHHHQKLVGSNWLSS